MGDGGEDISVSIIVMPLTWEKCSLIFSQIEVLFIGQVLQP